jgi:hypothetical protein
VADEDEEDEIESEDSDSVDPSTRSASVVGGRTLTARQAVLANVVDPTHVSLSKHQARLCFGSSCILIHPQTSLLPAEKRSR